MRNSCPVVEQMLEIAKVFAIEVQLVCDSSYDYSDLDVLVLQADKGRDQSDFLLLKHVADNDLVITQDYGLAALVLAKKGFVLSANGSFYSEQTIDELLFVRASAKRSGKYRHRKKRTRENDKSFAQALEDFLRRNGGKM